MADTIRDFTKPREIHRFKIDNDIFECSNTIPVNLQRKLMHSQVGLRPTGAGETMDLAAVEAQMDVVVEILDAIMMPASATRFAERMGSKLEPITTDQLGEVLTYLMEVFGERPTQQSSGSADSLSATGPTSTDGALLMESTPIPSISVAI
jgi:hypothetical protein